MVDDRGLEAGKAHVEALPLVEGGVEADGVGVPRLRQLLQLRPAGEAYDKVARVLELPRRTHRS